MAVSDATRREGAPQIDYDALADCTLVRTNDLIGPGRPFPISRMTLHRWVQAGRFPAPVKIAGGSMNYWRWGDVRPLLESQQEAA